MDKILFIVPPCIKFGSFINPSFNERIVIKKDGSYGSLLTDMPLGVLSLSAYVKKHTATETELIDFNIVLNEMESFKYSSFTKFFHDCLSAPRWKVYAPNIIGISSLFTSSYQNVLDIAQCCRDIFPNAVIVAGGVCQQICIMKYLEKVQALMLFVMARAKSLC